MSKPAHLVCCCIKPAPHTCTEDTGTVVSLFLSLDQVALVKIAEMSITVFFTSVSSSREIKKTQQKIFDVLSSKKINHVGVDIAQDIESKESMRELAQNPTALPPQICNGNQYCGDYDAFDNAIEEGTLESFLKL
ncbi:SH3 domain-binding glutamic acid-rich-like protein 3 [Pseudoliparis swirei]|uniref:SH3 domain-binding glutamic acid-rich-like protein 3 n=1 Tax=Pseudoliparis swirei TaxID=2059687 RepID=UPI0024BE3DEA|nr:SH3 domain-binding glutamic acid-rich-like protein 3 [Pseudoliparis swirei]